MKRTAFLILSLLAIYSTCTNAQIAAGYYHDGNMISLSTNPAASKMYEIRVSTTSFKQAGWNYNQNGVVQGYFFIDLLQNEPFRLYGGLGIGAPLLADLNWEDQWVSLNIPLGIRCNPFTRFPDLYILGEYLPMITLTEGKDVINTVSFGFKIKFGIKKD